MRRARTPRRTLLTGVLGVLSILTAVVACSSPSGSGDGQGATSGVVTTTSTTSSTSSGASTTTDTTSTTTDTASTTTTATVPGAVPVTKLLVFVVENHSLAQMRAQMPYTYRLAKNYGYATGYFGIRHPSLPNYLAIASGSTHAVTTNAAPADNVTVRGASVFGRAIAAGRAAAVYADAMPGRCALQPKGRYAVKHNPWPYFAQERSLCRQHDLPVTALGPAVDAGTLPHAGMVVPDLCHDAHDCSLATADRWFRTWMTRIQAGPDWRSGHLAVVLTADEDDKSAGNRVLTVVAHPSQRHRVVTQRLDHYSLTRLYAEVTGTTPLGRAAKAPSMAKAFQLPLP
ncbi:Phosphoesterase family protein [Pedococcus dokdonensis]|uniref:Phosphoesterase family protein n=1 Tax=Pedococcus dokdonensis TaxID=443156 RepID=A0A1H0MTM5_9MICO|nr:alkaline phosphatase family protein [Pedococcus dokdonensis]SDO83808.1 Phosphoesterase family protein [Pedococcus dokdonensis]